MKNKNLPPAPKFKAEWQPVVVTDKHWDKIYARTWPMFLSGDKYYFFINKKYYPEKMLSQPTNWELWACFY